MSTTSVLHPYIELTALQTYWNTRRLISHRVPDSSDFKKLAASSSPEDWERRAWSMFHEQQYSEAMLAFVRAENPQQSAVARAYHLREEAMDTAYTASKSQKRKRHDSAAEAFRECGRSAAKQSDKEEFFDLAGKLYRDADDFEKAAEMFKQASKFHEAVQCMRTAKMFDAALLIIREHPQEVQKRTADETLFDACMSCLKNNDLRYLFTI